MNPVLPTLLCLGLCLPRSTRQRAGALPRPSITALPGHVVQLKTPVTILCQGPPEAAAYHIFQQESSQSMTRTGHTGSVSSKAWNITEMTTDHAGLYVCSYGVGAQWSPLSAPLKLVVTGLYPKPSLSSLAGSVVAPGETVSLQCSSSWWFEVFVLTKEDGDLTTQNQNSSHRGHGFEAIFPLGPASPALTGTFRCYGAFRNHPYLWSHPSDQLQLEVNDAAKDAATEEPEHPTDPPPSSSFLERHQGLLIGLPVTTLLLCLLLFFIIRHCKGKNSASRKERGTEAAEPTDFEATDPQEVTYAQVTCSGPTQGTAATRQTLQSEYAMLALR